MSSSSRPAAPYLAWGISSQSMDRTYSVALLQGRRPAMTDALSAKSSSSLAPEADYYAVYEGYRGPTVAEHLRDQLERAIAEQVEHELVTDKKTMRFLLRSDNMAEWWRKTIRRAFWKVDYELVSSQLVQNNAGGVGSSSGDGSRELVGATAVVALVLENYMVVANSGFSKAVVARDGETVVLTPENEEDDVADLQMWVETTGVGMADVKLEKAMRTGRAFGSSLKEGVEMAAPEVIFVERELGDEFLILANEGVWGSVPPAAACAFIRERLHQLATEGASSASSATKLAEQLAEHVIDRGSQGNVSVVVVVFTTGGVISAA